MKKSLVFTSKRVFSLPLVNNLASEVYNFTSKRLAAQVYSAKIRGKIALASLGKKVALRAFGARLRRVRCAQRCGMRIASLTQIPHRFAIRYCRASRVCLLDV